MTTTTAPPPRHPLRSSERLLNASLIVAPVTYLAADTTYAARGWEDPTAGALHVLASILYGFVALRVAPGSLRPLRSRVAIVVTGLIGWPARWPTASTPSTCRLGDAQLVDQPGAANLIKPLGLFFPLALGPGGRGPGPAGSRWPGRLVLVAALLWPVGAHRQHRAR